MNKFKIIITSYNNSKWTEMCINSLLTQTYKNFEVIFFDDGSSDDTYLQAYNMIGCDTKFKINKLANNNTKSWIFVNLLDEYIDDTDIVLFLDGDDWLSSDEVLSAINQYYELHNPWVAYGGMVVWDGGESVLEPFPQNSEFPKQILDQKLFRKDTWRSSHTKTMRGFIWKSLDKNNFLSKLDGKYILGPDDLVIMFDALEKCPSTKIGRFDFPTYVYNHCQENADRIREHQTKRKMNYEQEIRSRTITSELSYITSELSGGVGNQMFQIAAVVSLADNLGFKAIFNSDTHFLPLQGKNINTYKNNIFKHIIFDKNFPIRHTYTQTGFHYTKIENIQPFTILKGGYQSEKYFNQTLIRKLFSPENDTKRIITELYGDVSDYTSIHVRRGDFLKLYPHHIFVGEDYYTKSIQTINSKKYLVFSDDIDWCKSFFKGNEFNFINDVDYNEMYVMSMCKNNIIGNSTFSWWGAWLNPNCNKIVIAPNNWFGPGYSHLDLSDLIPETWLKI